MLWNLPEEIHRAAWKNIPMQLLPSIPMGDPGCRIDASRSSESTSLDVWIDCCYMEPIDAVDSYGIPRRRMEAMRSSAAGLEGLVATCCQCFWSHQFQCGGLWILLQSIRIDQWALEDLGKYLTFGRSLKWESWVQRVALWRSTVA